MNIDAKRIAHFLGLHHRGRARAIKAPDLARALGVRVTENSAAPLRRAISTAVLDSDAPECRDIGSGFDGFYWIVTAPDAKAAREYLEKKHAKPFMRQAYYRKREQELTTVSDLPLLQGAE